MPSVTTNPYTMEQVAKAGGLAQVAVNEVKSNPYGLSDSLRSSDAYKYTEYVNAREIAAADKQMRFQEEQNAKAMAFNASEAEKNRAWQKMMSDSAHQREVIDFMKAGLNPVLGIIGSSGASTPSGSSASVSGAQGSKANVNSGALEIIATEMSKLLERQTSMQLQTEQLKTQMDIAKMQNAMSEFLGLLSSDSSKYGADLSAWSARYVADVNKAIAQLNNEGQLGRLLTELDWKEDNPQTIAGLIPYIINSVFPVGWNGMPSSGRTYEGVKQSGIRRGLNGILGILIDGARALSKGY